FAVGVMLAEIRIRKHRHARNLTERFCGAGSVNCYLGKRVSVRLNIDGTVAEKDTTISKQHCVHARHDLSVFTQAEYANGRTNRFLVWPAHPAHQSVDVTLLQQHERVPRGLPNHGSCGTRRHALSTASLPQSIGQLIVAL